jgi:general secretion pathway protein M
VTLTEHSAAPLLSRVAALAILAALVGVFCVGPLAAYCDLVTDHNDALATKAAMLERYKALADAKPGAAPAPDAALIYPDIPESQASALLQETLKNLAATARVQVQGLQVLRGEAQNGATRVGVRMRGSGDMASLRSLIYAIEAARPLLYPDNLQIQSHVATAGAAPSALDFQFDISGFKAGPQS